MQLLAKTACPPSIRLATRSHRDSAMALSATALPDRWHFSRITESERGFAERFISEQFFKAYRARITEFMPELMGLYDGDTLAAACGLRRAQNGPMFLEQYLEHPAEILLHDMTGLNTGRRGMVEVGNLSISRPGYARHLVYWLTMYLRSREVQWAVFSAVPALLNNFRRLGIPLINLGPANPDKLQAEAKCSWGSYYEQQPQVTAVRVDAAYKALCGQ